MAHKNYKLSMEGKNYEEVYLNFERVFPEFRVLDDKLGKYGHDNFMMFDMYNGALIFTPFETEECVHIMGNLKMIGSGMSIKECEKNIKSKGFKLEEIV